MSKYIIHPGTGTVIDADECLVLDLDNDLTDEERDRLEGDDYFDDALVCTIAEERGKKFPGIDLTYSNCIAFSPNALREEALYMIEQWDYDESDELYPALKWCIGTATDDQLNRIAVYILDNDLLWKEFRDSVIDGISKGYQWHGKEGK